MIVLVDEEGSSPGTASGRRFRQAPPVSSNIGGKEWDASFARERRHLNTYSKDEDRLGGPKAERFQPSGTTSPVGRSRERRSEPQRLDSASASEFSFNLRT